MLLHRTLKETLRAATFAAKAAGGSEESMRLQAYLAYAEDDEFKELTAESRNALPESAFVFPGDRRYPIHDRKHAATAMAYSKGTKDHAAVMRAVCKKYPDMPACKLTHEESEGDAMWIEVFKTGTHTSNSGATKTYTREDLENMVTMYNSQTDHEAPVVLGHPKTDDPAYGWAKKLKTVGEKLYAYVDQLNDKLVSAVRKGAYKKVSIAIYPNGLLRHIGFLGAAPPAVKGLAPLSFSANEEFEEFSSEYSGWATYEHRIPMVGKMFSRMREYFIEKHGREEADKILPKDHIDIMMKDPQETYVPDEPTVPTGNGYSQPTQEEEMDIKELEEKVAKLTSDVAAIQTNGTQFSEQQNTLQKSIETLTSGFATLSSAVTEGLKGIAQHKVSARKVAIDNFSQFCERMIVEGRVLPAEKEGLVEEFTELITLEEGMTFAEGAARPTEKLEKRLSSRPQLVVPRKKVFASKESAHHEPTGGEIPAQFSEVADQVDMVSVAVDTEVKKLMTADPKLTYAEAFEKYTTGN